MDSHELIHCDACDARVPRYETGSAANGFDGLYCLDCRTSSAPRAIREAHIRDARRELKAIYG